jgi:transcription antitermination factor NusG
MEDKKWMAIYTKPRNEKVVNERLLGIGIETYLPLHETIRQWSDRKKKVKMPLFTSYVFVKVNETERLKVLKENGVLNFVFWLGKPAIIQQIEIDKIRYFLKEAVNQDIITENISRGEDAIVSSGLMKGQKVEILDSDKKEYFVNIHSLGVRLRISKLDVEKVK